MILRRKRFQVFEVDWKVVSWVLFVAACEMNVKILLTQTVQYIGIVYAFDVFFRTFYTWDDQHAIPSSTQGTASLSSTASLDNSLSDMYRSPPRPLPYDADPRYFRLQRDGLVSRREKGSSHAHEETEPLRRSEVDEDSEQLSTAGKWNECTGVEESKEYNSRSSLKLSVAKTTTGFAHIFSSSEDEDVCPTCLEEYTTENPKIITKCSHHFHLSCIYEWMERSESCPVCGQVMAFDETT